MFINAKNTIYPVIVEHIKRRISLPDDFYLNEEKDSDVINSPKLSDLKAVIMCVIDILNLEDMSEVDRLLMISRYGDSEVKKHNSFGWFFSHLGIWNLDPKWLLYDIAKKIDSLNITPENCITSMSVFVAKKDERIRELEEQLAKARKEPHAIDEQKDGIVKELEQKIEGLEEVIKSQGEFIRALQEELKRDKQQVEIPIEVPGRGLVHAVDGGSNHARFAR